MGLTIGGVASDNRVLKSIGLSMVAIPALISGGIAVAAGVAGATALGVIGGTSGLAGFVGNNLGINSNYYPANDGFTSISRVVLNSGDYLQRIGGEEGTYVSSFFTDPFSLSLSYDKLSQINDISVYEVLKPIAVNAGHAVPFFGQYGGGVQYDLGKSIAKLITEGFLRRL